LLSRERAVDPPSLQRAEAMAFARFFNFRTAPYEISVKTSSRKQNSLFYQPKIYISVQQSYRKIV